MTLSFLITALFCHTNCSDVIDKKSCAGNWLTTTSNRQKIVASGITGLKMNSNQNKSLVRLYRNNNSHLQIEGLYYCKVSYNKVRNLTAYVGLYNEGKGNHVRNINFYATRNLFFR